MKSQMYRKYMQYYELQTKWNNQCIEVLITTMLHIVINTQKIHMVLKQI